MSQPVTVTEYPTYTHMTGEIYDLIYSDKDYKAETEKILDIVQANSKSQGKRMLDVACGTGAHLQYLRQSFEVDGVDLSVEQVAAAKVRFPENRIEQGDMLDYEMNAKYDVVIC